jgi:methionine-rich copper-binding protein CopC
MDELYLSAKVAAGWHLSIAQDILTVTSRTATGLRPRGYIVMTRFTRGGLTFALFGAAIVASLAFAPDSFAARRHVHLKKSTPANKETVTGSPKSISLWFSEKVELAVTNVKVADAKGVAAELGALKREAADTAPVVTDVLKPLGAGRYTLTWSVAGKDGHPQKGTVSFTVKAAH